MSCRDALASMPIVKLAVACGANVWHVLTDAPDATTAET
jgi:hypothetical protein